MDKFWPKLFSVNADWQTLGLKNVKKTKLTVLHFQCFNRRNEQSFYEAVESVKNYLHVE